MASCGSRANGISDAISFVRDVARLEVRARDEKSDEARGRRASVQTAKFDDEGQGRLDC